MKLGPYRKAIVAAVAGLLATAYAVIYQDDPGSIPGSTEAIQGVLTTILVYVLRNDPN